MDYISALRGRRALFVLTIVCGAVLLINVIIRLSLPAAWMHGPTFGDLAKAKGSVVTHTTLPDGAKETVIENAREHQRVVTIDRGYLGITVTRTRPAQKNDSRANSGKGPSFTVSEESRTVGNTHTTTMRIGARTDLGLLASMAMLVGLILATIRSCAFAAENEGHLELSFTRPQPRDILALRVIGTDILTIVAAEILTVVTAIATLAVYIVPHLAVSAYTVATFLAAVLIPTAWYAMLLCASASLKRGCGIVLGLAWPVALGIIGGSTVQSPFPVLQAIRLVCSWLKHLDPLWYLQAVSINSSESVQSIASVWNRNTDLAMLSVAILAAIYLIAAVLQWRRVEA